MTHCQSRATEKKGRESSITASSQKRRKVERRRKGCVCIFPRRKWWKRKENKTGRSDCFIVNVEVTSFSQHILSILSQWQNHTWPWGERAWNIYFWLHNELGHNTRSISFSVRDLRFPLVPLVNFWSYLVIACLSQSKTWYGTDATTASPSRQWWGVRVFTFDPPTQSQDVTQG